jgi:hypothetical protein
LRAPGNRLIDQNAPHYFRGDCKKVRPVLPLDSVPLDQSQASFIDQGGWLKRVTGRLLFQVEASEPPQFSLHYGRQLLQRAPVTVAPGLQADRYFAGLVWHGPS